MKENEREGRTAGDDNGHSILQTSLPLTPLWIPFSAPLIRSRLWRFINLFTYLLTYDGYNNNDYSNTSRRNLSVVGKISGAYSMTIANAAEIPNFPIMLKAVLT